MSHDHVVNGIAPVKGCDICDRIVKSAIYNENKETSGRLPPWVWNGEGDE